MRESFLRGSIFRGRTPLRTGCAKRGRAPLTSVRGTRAIRLQKNSSPSFGIKASERPERQGKRATSTLIPNLEQAVLLDLSASVRGWIIGASTEAHTSEMQTRRRTTYPVFFWK